MNLSVLFIFLVSIFTGPVRLISQPTFEVNGTAFFSNSTITMCKMDKEGEFIATYDDENKVVRVIRKNNLELYWQLQLPKKSRMTDFHFDSGRSLLILGMRKSGIKVLDLRAKKVSMEVRRTPINICFMDYSPVSASVLIGDCSKKIQTIKVDSLMSDGYHSHSSEIRVKRALYGIHGKDIVAVSNDLKIIYQYMNHSEPAMKTTVKEKADKSDNRLSNVTINQSNGDMAICYDRTTIGKHDSEIELKHIVTLFHWRGKEIRSFEGNSKAIKKLCFDETSDYFIADNSDYNESRISFWNTSSSTYDLKVRVNGEIFDFDYNQKMSDLIVFYRELNDDTGTKLLVGKVYFDDKE